MDDQTLCNLLSHIDKSWHLVAITQDEVYDLRAMGYVEHSHLALTQAGKDKLVELALVGYAK